MGIYSCKGDGCIGKREESCYGAEGSLMVLRMITCF